MLYKSNKSFCGLVTMKRGQVKELKDEAIIKDLLRAGYIEPFKAEGKSEGLPKAEANVAGVKTETKGKRGRKPKASEV